MTLFDKKFEFSDDQDIAASTLSASAIVVSTNTMDLGSDQKNAFGASVLTQNIGAQAKSLELVLHVGAEAFTGSSATVVASLVSKAANASLSSGATSHGSVTFAALSAIGTKKNIKIPNANLNRYLGVIYKAVGGNLTAGYMNAYLAEADQLAD